MPHLAAAETIDIEGTEKGPDWRGGGREGGGKRRMKVCEGGREI